MATSGGRNNPNTLCMCSDSPIRLKFFVPFVSSVRTCTVPMATDGSMRGLITTQALCIEAAEPCAPVTEEVVNRKNSAAGLPINFDREPRTE